MATSSECTACRIDYFHISDVRLCYSACEHRVCERCIGRLWQLGRVYPCPACGRSLRAEDFSDSSKDERQVMSELQIRRQVCEIFCHTAEDFEKPSEFDDYLEKREDLIDRVARPASHGDEKEAWREVNAYKDANAEHILRAQQLQPRRKLAKILGIIDEEGGFHQAVNADWDQNQAPPGAASHPFHERYKTLLSGHVGGAAGKPPLLSRGLSTVGASGGGTAAQDGPGSPFVPQPLHGEYGPADVTRQMRGGGQSPDTCRQKARHFFFAELAAATAAFASNA